MTPISPESKEYMSHPKIAVAIPTYDRREMLLRLIDSIPHEWEIFVSDNDASLVPLSNPFPLNVAVSHAESLIPIFSNWNRALSLVDRRCTHVFIPSDDDIFFPSVQNSVTQTLLQHPEGDVFIFGCDFFNEHEKYWKGYCPKNIEVCKSGSGFNYFIRGVDARMPCIMFRKDFLDRIGGFDERFTLTAADSELIQRALLLGTSVFVPEVVGAYRIWQGGLTHTRQATDLWMNEINLWTNKISNLLQETNLVSTLCIDLVGYRDQIFALNLLAGVAGLMARGEYKQAQEFLICYPTPARANWKTRMNLARQRLKLWRGAKA